jgi:hypothetical protein
VRSVVWVHSDGNGGILRFWWGWFRTVTITVVLSYQVGKIRTANDDGDFLVGFFITLFGPREFGTTTNNDSNSPRMIQLNQMWRMSMTGTDSPGGSFGRKNAPTTTTYCDFVSLQDEMPTKEYNNVRAVWYSVQCTSASYKYLYS